MEVLIAGQFKSMEVLIAGQFKSIVATINETVDEKMTSIIRGEESMLLKTPESAIVFLTEGVPFESHENGEDNKMHNNWLFFLLTSYQPLSLLLVIVFSRNGRLLMRTYSCFFLTIGWRS
jgi:hypothetical protein